MEQRRAHSRLDGLAIRLLMFVGVAACGGSAPATDAATSCGAIGAPCGAGCPNALECVNNVCVPVLGDCGGFAGAACLNTSLTCTYPVGNSGGICMQQDQKACVCAIAPNALGDCMAP
jgi:hypothetical protein